MNKILADYKNECAKLFNRKKYYVFMAIEVLICGIVILTKLLTNSLSKGAVSFDNISSALTLMTLFIEIIIPFIVMMATCEMFSEEFQSKTIRAVFMRPIARYKIYLGKYFAVLTLAVVNMLVVMLAANLMDLLIVGNLNNLGYSILAYIIDIIPMMVLIMMAVMINQLVNNSTMSMFLCIIIYICLKLAGVYFTGLSGLVFTGYMQWHKLWLGAGMPVGTMISRIALLLGYGITFTSVGYYIFRFKEC